MDIGREAVRINLPEMVGKGYGSFWRSRKRYRVVKGGRASKKSRTMALWLIYNIMRHPGANAMVVRKVYNTHKDSTYAVLRWAIERLGVRHLWDCKVSPLEIVYRPTGQVILFRGFDDPLKLTSITVSAGILCWVWLEEAYEIDDEADFRVLDETIRGAAPEGLYKQITLTFNPWVQSHWTKARFFDREDPDAFALTTTYRCNEWLDDADRELIERVKHDDPDRYKVIGLGEYGIPGGAYFTEFRRDIHVIKPFALPDHWRRYIALDYGLDMLACYWIAVDEQRRAYVYRELYEPNLIISEAARRIKELTYGERIETRYAPPDLYNRRQDTGQSAAEIFAREGVPLVRARNERVQGWYALREWLRPCMDEFGETVAHLRIFDACPNLIRTLPALQADKRDPNDVSTEPHELTHAPDAIRYFVAGRPSPTVVPVARDPDDAPEYDDQVESFLDYGL